MKVPRKYFIPLYGFAIGAIQHCKAMRAHSAAIKKAKGAQIGSIEDRATRTEYSRVMRAFDNITVAFLSTIVFLLLLKIMVLFWAVNS